MKAKIDKYLIRGVIEELKRMSVGSILTYENNKPIKSFEKLRTFLGLSDGIWRRVKKILCESTLIKNGTNIFLNPIISNQFNIIVFDVFEDHIKKNEHHLEYLKLKSSFYRIDHPISVTALSDIPNNISGIYRLYKNKEIVYIGKSKCIKTRVSAHTKEKDTDSFDFTILSNESDKNIYELYYIDKHKPLYNNDCVEDSTTTITLEDLIFSNIIKI